MKLSGHVILRLHTIREWAEAMIRSRVRDPMRDARRYQDLSLRELVETTRHGRNETGRFLVDGKRLVRYSSRCAYAAAEVPDELLERIADSKMADRHRKLDRLLGTDKALKRPRHE